MLKMYGQIWYKEFFNLNASPSHPVAVDIVPFTCAEVLFISSLESIINKKQVQWLVKVVDGAKNVRGKQTFMETFAKQSQILEVALGMNIECQRICIESLFRLKQWKKQWKQQRKKERKKETKKCS